MRVRPGPGGQAQMGSMDRGPCVPAGEGRCSIASETLARTLGTYVLEILVDGLQARAHTRGGERKGERTHTHACASASARSRAGQSGCWRVCTPARARAGMRAQKQAASTPTLARTVRAHTLRASAHPERMRTRSHPLRDGTTRARKRTGAQAAP